jgi:hypothetical protein
MMETLPKITSWDSISENNEQTVRLVGKYTQIDVRKRPTAPPRYLGHVAIILEDNSRVLLYPIWHPSTIRPAAEIKQFEGKQVEVIGTLVEEAPENPGDPAMPNLILPCMIEVKSIQAI